MSDYLRLCKPIFLTTFFVLVALSVSCRSATPTPVSVTPTRLPPSPTASTILTSIPTPCPSDTPSSSRLEAATTSLTPTLVPTPTPLPQGGHVVEIGLAGISTLNPLLAQDDLSRDLSGLLFDSLLRVNPQTAALLPGLAQDWQISDDALVFTFHLRPDVTWHDGQPLSAADVAFTLAVASDPKGPSPYRYDLAQIARVTAPDDKTVIVTLNQPGCDALYALGRVPILPRHLLAGQDLAEATFNQQPVGSGPFTFDTWGPGGDLELAANEDYWAGGPYLDRWTYRMVSDTMALREALEQGQAHLARLPDDLRAEPLPGAIRILSYPADRWHFLALNNDHPALGDTRVRQALALALDRRRLLEVVLEGQGELLDAPWLADHWALSGGSPASPAYAPDLAGQLLLESGWGDSDGDGFVDKNGERLELNIVANLENPAREEIAILAQQYWQAVGIAAQVNVSPWGVFLDDLFRHTFDIAVFDWPLEPGPDQSWLWAAAENDPGIGFNFCSYASPQADALLEQGRLALGCDANRRAIAYGELARQLAADQPYIFLFAAHNRLAVSGALAGPQPGPYGGLYWNIAAWHLTEVER